MGPIRWGRAFHKPVSIPICCLFLHVCIAVHTSQMILKRELFKNKQCRCSTHCICELLDVPKLSINVVHERRKCVRPWYAQAHILLSAYCDRCVHLHNICVQPYVIYGLSAVCLHINEIARLCACGRILCAMLHISWAVHVDTFVHNTIHVYAHKNNRCL